MKRTLTALTAAITVIAALPAITLSASAEPMPPDVLPPDWVPSSFIEALQFENTYGTTHIEGNTVCFVMQNQIRDDAEYVYEANVRQQEDIACGGYLVWDNTYTFEKPEKPDESTATKEELTAYELLMSELGLREEWSMEPRFTYQVVAYQLSTGDGLDFTPGVQRKGSDSISKGYTYSFDFTTAGELMETDIYGWLPDSVPEYRDFKEKNGICSLHDGYIVYADDVCGDGGISLLTDQKGTALLECVRSMNVQQTYVVPPVGGSDHIIKVYSVKRPGTVKLRFVQMRTFGNPSDSVSDDQSFCFEIAPDGKTEPIEEEKVETLTRGDSSGDGTLSIADAAVLQKYLLGTGELAYWQNADLNNDGRLSAADFSLLKQMLLAQADNPQNENDLPPVTDDIKLITPWAEKGLGGYTYFAVDCSLDFRLNMKLDLMTLYDADTNEKLRDFGSTGDGTPELNLRTDDITEECTKRYYAIADCVATDGTAVKLRTNTLTIHFTENPAP